jgi:hypothetical protein
MITQIKVDDDGVVMGGSSSNVEQDGFVTVSQEVFDQANSTKFNGWKYMDGELVAFEVPTAPTITVIPKLELYRRMTDAEYEQMQAGVASQSARIQDVFRMVDNFRENDTLWPLLVSMGHQLFGEERTAELLAPVTA